VGWRENPGTSEGSCSNRRTPRHVEVGNRVCNLQARNGRLHETQGVSLQFSTTPHGDSCQEDSGREKRSAKRWPVWKQEEAVGNRRSGNHGRHSPCGLERGPHRCHTPDGHQGSFPERRDGETDPHNGRQRDGPRSHTMEGKISDKLDIRNGNLG